MPYISYNDYLVSNVQVFFYFRVIGFYGAGSIEHFHLLNSNLILPRHYLDLLFVGFQYSSFSSGIRQ